LNFRCHPAEPEGSREKDLDPFGDDELVTVALHC
jgi:hypothetical protein